VIGLERGDGSRSRYETVAFPRGIRQAEANLFYCGAAREVLLWGARRLAGHGGWAPGIARHIRRVYAAKGPRAVRLPIYGRAGVRDPSGDRPATRRCGRGCGNRQSLGGSLDGRAYRLRPGRNPTSRCSAVLGREAVFGKEIVWEPVEQVDPAYHYERIMARLKLAASKLPRVDAIGGSSAGIYVDNGRWSPHFPGHFSGALRRDPLDVCEDSDEFGVPLWSLTTAT